MQTYKVYAYSGDKHITNLNGIRLIGRRVPEDQLLAIIVQAEGRVVIEREAS